MYICVRRAWRGIGFVWKEKILYYWGVGGEILLRKGKGQSIASFRLFGDKSVFVQLAVAFVARWVSLFVRALVRDDIRSFYTHVKYKVMHRAVHDKLQTDVEVSRCTVYRIYYCSLASCLVRCGDGKCARDTGSAASEKQDVPSRHLCESSSPTISLGILMLLCYCRCTASRLSCPPFTFTHSK